MQTIVILMALVVLYLLIVIVCTCSGTGGTISSKMSSSGIDGSGGIGE